MVLNIDLSSLEARFLHYVSLDTQSDETSPTYPSTSGQWTLLRLLFDELQGLGVKDVQLSPHGYVIAHLP